jgi:hypothetical protein
MKLFSISILIISLTGCSSMKNLGKLAFGGLVGAATNEMTDEPAAGIAAGVVAYAAADGLDNKIQEDEKNIIKDSYNAGQADMAKHMYWTLQDMQKADSKSKKQPIYSEYTFPAPTEKNGVHYLPHDVKLRVIEGYKK